MTVGSTGDSGGCSLRSVIEAVEAGTSNGCGTFESPTTTIHLPANTITLGPQLVVNQGNMAIVGDESNPAGTVIKGGSDRVMEVKASATVELAGLEITGGHTPNGGTAPGLYTENVVGKGGGILNKGSLTLEHAVVTENRTGNGDLGLNGSLEGAGGSGGRGGSGGGIFNELGASLTIRQSTISKNLTGDGGKGGEGGAGVNAIGHFPNGGDGGAGGASGDGGGIYSAGTLTIEGSTISGNFTGRGGEGGTGHVGTGEVEEFSPGKGGDGGEGGNSGKCSTRRTRVTTPTSEWRRRHLQRRQPDDGQLDDQRQRHRGRWHRRRLGRRWRPEQIRALRGSAAGRAPAEAAAAEAASSPARATAATRRCTLTNVTIYGNRTGDGGTGGPGGGGENRPSAAASAAGAATAAASGRRARRTAPK